ncbi:MAG TPA: hypothetical protein VGR57_16865 [Ktedonobacterales bacterium]|nr:hypothetical protein [Ktedonobacterales bacterium]
MQLHFDRGDPQAPRGHAILYARSGGADGPLLATYCVVLPIAFSIGKYLPPMLSGQMPPEALGGGAAMSVVPIPPMLEDAPGLATLQQLAERRDDDLCDMGTIFLNDDGQRLNFAAEAAAEYGQLMERYTRTWPAVAAEAPASAAGPTEELDVDAVLAEVLSDRDRLAELARSVGTLRYAMDGHDQALIAQTERKMRHMAAGLSEKYRADQLIAAALSPEPSGAQLAQLYLQRAYKLADEDYAAIPPLEREIRELRGEPG